MNIGDTVQFETLVNGDLAILEGTLVDFATGFRAVLARNRHSGLTTTIPAENITSHTAKEVAKAYNASWDGNIDPITCY